MSTASPAWLSRDSTDWRDTSRLWMAALGGGFAIAVCLVSYRAGASQQGLRVAFGLGFFPWACGYLLLMLKKRSQNGLNFATFALAALRDLSSVVIAVTLVLVAMAFLSLALAQQAAETARDELAKAEQRLNKAQEELRSAPNNKETQGKLAAAEVSLKQNKESFAATRDSELSSSRMFGGLWPDAMMICLASFLGFVAFVKLTEVSKRSASQRRRFIAAGHSNLDRYWGAQNKQATVLEEAYNNFREAEDPSGVRETVRSFARAGEVGRVIEALGHDEAKPEFAEALRTVGPVIRAKILRSLSAAGYGDPAVIADLLYRHILEDDDEMVSHAATDSLMALALSTGMDREEIVRNLKAGLRSGDPGVRQRAVLRLGEFARQSFCRDAIRELIRPLANDKVPTVREEADAVLRDLREASRD
jgi:hypothetical protein